MRLRPRTEATLLGFRFFTSRFTLPHPAGDQGTVARSYVRASVAVALCRGTLRLPSLRATGPPARVWRQRDYAEPACPRVWTLNDVSLAPTRKVYRLIRAISPSGVLASTFSRVSLRCRLAWKSESVVMLRAAASCSESKPKHQSSRLSFSEAVKRGAFEAVDSAWSGT